MSDKLREETLPVEFVSGVEGPHISLNNFRLVGPKAWGGGKVQRSWTCTVGDILRAVPSLAYLEAENVALRKVAEAADYAVAMHDDTWCGQEYVDELEECLTAWKDANR